METTTVKKDWRPECYQLQRLLECELADVDGEPLEGGMRGFSIPMPDGGEVEVFFRECHKDVDKGCYVRREASHGEVIQAVETAWGWISGMG